MTTVLVFYPQMQIVIDRYVSSPSYRGERIMPIEEFEQSSAIAGGVVIFGRNGHYHHYDLRHMEVLRRNAGIADAENTTLVLYDWHEDLDHDPKGTALGNASWGYLGLTQGLYSNMYAIGMNPRGFNELNAFLYDDEIRQTTEETMKILDRVYLYPAAPSYYCLKYFHEYEPYLAANPSVSDYFVVRDAGAVLVRFKSAAQVEYELRRAAVVVSIDLDVLKRSELRADTPQGAMSVADLLVQMRRLQTLGRISAVFICGLTERADLLDERSWQSTEQLLSRCVALLETCA